MQESSITIKGQTTLPKDIRKALALKPGDKLRYIMLDNGEVRLVRTRPVMELAGALRNDREPVSLEDMERAIAAGATDR